MTDGPTMAVPQPPRELVGGRYALESLVGRGGSAEVWAATDTALGRRVAVKLVTASGGEDAGRVNGEARLLASLNHPGLVPVYDAGTDERGRPWVVMELVEGETLGDVVRRGPLPPLEVAAAGAALSEALAYVHAQGMVHRDVKPANLLQGRDGRVRLTDFGIARLVDAAKVTATGLTVGTASYLSPEQVTGAHVGPPTDVYALGLVLLELLTGRREYPGAAVEVAIARLHRSPEVPDSLPAGWPGLLRAMTDSDPARRPQMAAVAEDLRRVQAGGQATTAVPLPVLQDRTQVIDRTQLLDRTQVAPRTRREVSAPPPPPGRNGWKWALALVFLVVLGVAGLVATQQGERLPTGEPVQVERDLPKDLRDDVQRLQDEVER